MLWINFINSQQNVFYNKGDIYLLNGENIYINGNFINSDNGQISNYGTIHLSGNWTNNATNQVFTSATGTVRLFGANQTIGGSTPTAFNNLTLEGTGIKTLNINTSIAGTLALNDREIATQNYTLSILSTNTNAITRTTGFVSTEPNGTLLRNTSGIDTWLFPMGSSNPTLGYRPVEITTTVSGANAFEITLINQNPTSNGYDINLYQPPVCIVNHKYFHKIKQNSGNNNITLKYYYDNIADGAFTIPVEWNGNMWTTITNSTHTTNISPNLSYFTLSNFIPQNPSIIAFADSAPANGTPIIYELNNTLYAAQGNTFQWYLNGNIIPQATQNYYTPTVPGNYSVYVTTAGGCSFMSANYYFYFVNIDKTTSSTPNIRIFPNPFSSNFIIEITNTTILEENNPIYYKIADITGKTIKNECIENITGHKQYIINAENLTSGLYFISISNKYFSFTHKIIKL